MAKPRKPPGYHEAGYRQQQPEWAHGWLEEHTAPWAKDQANQLAGYHLASRPDPQGIPHTIYTITAALRLVFGRNIGRVCYMDPVMEDLTCRICGARQQRSRRRQFREWHRDRCAARLFALLTEEQARQIRLADLANTLAEEAGEEGEDP